jgi:hypothetical protein
MRTSEKTSSSHLGGVNKGKKKRRGQGYVEGPRPESS